MGLFDHVQPGDPTGLFLRAPVLNAVLDAAAKARGGPKALAEAKRGRASGGVVPVRNGSGADLGRFGILGIDEPIFDPSDSDALQAFKNTAALEGIVPAVADHAGRFVILLEPAKNGAIVPGLVAGVTPVQVDVQAESDGFADVADGITGHLKSGQSGAAQILWKEAGTGVKWAVVRVGPSCQPGFWARLTSEASGGGGYYSWTRLKDDGETLVDPPVTGTDDAKEVNAVEGIPVGGAGTGTVVWMWKDAMDDPDEWRFAYGGLPLADARYNALVANGVDLIFRPGWVRAH